MADILDRYYTPPELATELVSKVKRNHIPSYCIDTTCGSGQLLEAASQVFPNISCIGIDKDQVAIRRLRRRYPQWHLSVGDMLSRTSYSKTQAVQYRGDMGFCFINPPFSHKGKKSVNTYFNGYKLSSSVAMSYVLTSLEIFKPKAGGLIILPESVVHSETDEESRKAIESIYRIDIIDELPRKTFSGVRANAVVVNLVPRLNGKKKSTDLKSAYKMHDKSLKIYRGGLPVHSAVNSRFGFPYLHTTNIREHVMRQKRRNDNLVKPISRGIVSGWTILLPRVGVPSKELVQPIFLVKSTQLSDCVIAMKFSSKENAIAFSDLVLRNWVSLLMIYKGTGAKYTTLTKLAGWVGSLDWSLEGN